MASVKTGTRILVAHPGAGNDKITYNDIHFRMEGNNGDFVEFTATTPTETGEVADLMGTNYTITKE